VSALASQAVLPGLRIPLSFFERPCLQVAPELVGCLLVRRLATGERLIGRIVEVEAYLGDGSDPGSHSHRGPTARNRSMFGPPARLYTYRSYGVHTCANLVCEPPGSGAAVLLRAVEPLAGVESMRRRRGLGARERLGPRLASGPGRLAQAFGLGLEHDGIPALGGELCIRRPAADASPLKLARGPRVGLTRGADLPYRFFAEGSPFVSAWRPGKRRR
jgi:DNA-3-methyladenine glycosylase